ncbi:Zn(II)2Cys6 transcription factor domain-containing protein [Aspergillus undulatus]|uniref:Zn(II)2Cys6 transcription factor domain-containing protein n=1 Tax=Aspergillus undulatus TaxID=1810928 RepID=UPI003CCCEFFE
MNRQVGPTRKRLRVNTGCRTCRTRKVKCDEAKPTCRNCTKRNRVCRYDSSSENLEANDPVVTEDVRNDHAQPLPSSPDLASIFLLGGRSPFLSRRLDFSDTPDIIFPTLNSAGFGGEVGYGQMPETHQTPFFKRNQYN